MTQAVEPGEYYLIAAQFENVGTDGTVNIADVVKVQNISAYGYDGMETHAAELLVSVPSGYKHYYYINEAYDSDDHEILGDVWADGAGYELTEEDYLTPGDGFWFTARTDVCGVNPAITVAGQVTKGTSIGKDVIGSAEGYLQILANPFPVAADLRKVITTGLVAHGYDGMETEANEIMVSVTSGYKHYYYINEALDADDHDILDDIWADGAGYECTDADLIPAGAAFWVKAFQNGNISFDLTK